jgi:hypothetical protein
MTRKLLPDFSMRDSGSTFFRFLAGAVGPEHTQTEESPND